MDLSEFLDVSCDVGEESIQATEDDIVLIDDDTPAPPHSAAVNGSASKKRQLNGGGGSRPPPAKKVRNNNKNLKQMGVKKSNLSQQALGVLNNSSLTIKKVASSPQSRPAPRPAIAGSITWKYKQLAENLYNADIGKADLLKAGPDMVYLLI